MGAGGDLGHDAAEGGMLLDLAEHDVGQDLAAPAALAAFHDAAAVSSQLVSMPRTIISRSGPARGYFTEIGVRR